MTALMPLARLIARGDERAVLAALAKDPALAAAVEKTGATRTGPKGFWLSEISHYVYAGDTALHVAAAAFDARVAKALVKAGADCRARNRRGAEPLHYAADTNHWDPDAQVETIAVLIRAGADPDAVDKSGVAPLHRAVRTRSAPAVRALLKGGADPTLENGNGSTPLDLAGTTTGRGGSGSQHARAQQAEIQKLLRAALRRK